MVIMMGITKIEFAHCIYEVHEYDRLCVTKFDDGSELVAAPNYTPEDIARAHALGYGGDTWKMSKEHEFTHTILAIEDGLPWSHTLHGVAIGEPFDGADEEEAAVLQFQKLHNEMNLLRSR